LAFRGALARNWRHCVQWIKHEEVPENSHIP